ncbi:MaoC family dehydratase [Sphingomonas sp. CFBP 8760]|uniref:MaoC/PaaZ C-terminal domain-containing protein n=2 Tax=Sphingomonas sp. CFBP 8760 TaxID=2775282 RepID=UPI001781DFB0|nr:MaoC family dehydratase [Sphingomonas sp. CFBP 8760]
MATISIADMRQRVGTEAFGDWVTVDQAMIDAFADATGDRQFIHVDPVAAAATPFGGTIAHGFLTLSLMPRLAASVADAPVVEGMRMAVNYGANKLRFLSPVRSGSRVRGRFVTLAFDERKPGNFHHLVAFTAEIEGQDTPALIAEWITLIVV